MAKPMQVCFPFITETSHKPHHGVGQNKDNIVRYNQKLISVNRAVMSFALAHEVECGDKLHLIF